jgi:hypothetical protein
MSHVHSLPSVILMDTGTNYRITQLQLDRAMMGHDKAHIDIIDVAFFMRVDNMTHGLHLNFRGKRRLTHPYFRENNWGNKCEALAVLLLSSILKPCLYILKSKHFSA